MQSTEQMETELASFRARGKPEEERGGVLANVFEYVFLSRDAASALDHNNGFLNAHGHHERGNRDPLDRLDRLDSDIDNALGRAIDGEIDLDRAVEFVTAAYREWASSVEAPEIGPPRGGLRDRIIARLERGDEPADIARDLGPNAKGHVYRVWHRWMRNRGLE